MSGVVITGTGLITPLGLTREATWQAVLGGHCGMGPMPALEQPLPEGRNGGQAPDLPTGFEPGKPREVRYLRRAILDALAQANLGSGLPGKPDRCGVIIGTTLHGMRRAGKFLRTDDASHLRQFMASDVLAAAVEGLGFGGLAATTCSACSSSLGSIALGVTLLQSGELDLVIAGGYDPVSEYAYAGFNSLRLVAEGPLRPFCRDRQGMKLSEGYAIVVLERAEDARRRGTKAFVTVAGFGESADAHHLTQPHPQGEGAAAAMEQAIRSAGLSASDIDLMVAHATGTPDNDASEYAAMKRVMGDRLPQVSAVAFKSHLGHTLGGAGAVELILAAMALREGVVPPCANVQKAELQYEDLNLCTGAPTRRAIRATLSTSLGFGGANTCVVLTPADTPHPAPAIISRTDDHQAVITGVGVVVPGAIGNAAFAQLLGQDGPGFDGSAPGIAEEQIAHLVNARRARRISEYVRFLLAAASVAVEDATIADPAAFARECSAILGTTHGSCNYSNTYYQQVVSEGLLAANPMLFAEGVPNAGSAHLSLMLGIKGACQTIIGSRTAGLDALQLAATRIQTGQWSRAIIGAAEEFSPLTNRAYSHCGLCRERVAGLPFGEETGFASAAGAVVLVLESRRSAQERGARIRAAVGGMASRFDPAHRGVRGMAAALNAIGLPKSLISSANATWIDRSEACAIEHACSTGDCGLPAVSSLYGHMGETFSVMPLAGIAAALLTGHLPRLRGKANGFTPSDGTTPATDFGVLCTDYTGLASAVRLTAEGQR